MSVYKDMRQKGQQQQVETQAYGLTELEDKYQIVVDVNGYSAGDVSVKAVGDLELVVEAKKCETSTDGKCVTSSFSRRFELPGYVRLDAVSSALSKDGILTVSAPKLNPAITSKQVPANASTNESQQMNGNTLHGNFFDERQRMCDTGLSHMLSDLDLESRNKFQDGFRTEVARNPAPAPAPSRNVSSDVIEENDHYKIVLDTTGYTPNDISVKAVGERELQIEGTHVEKNSTGSETSQNFSRRFCLPGLVKLEAITSSLSPDGKLTIRAPKKQEQPQQNPNVLSQSHLHGVPVNNNSVQQNSQNFSKVYKSDNLGHPASGFDDFFNDDFGMGSMMTRRANPSSFMEKARNDYEENIRNMRNRHFAIDTQPAGFFSDFPAMQSTEETSSDIVESENDYKVKLDVSKYGPKDISVKAVGEKELLIEGKHQAKQTGGPAISQCFSRKFSLPGLVKFEAITSSLSPEGILTITAPKI